MNVKKLIFYGGLLGGIYLLAPKPKPGEIPPGEFAPVIQREIPSIIPSIPTPTPKSVTVVKTVYETREIPIYITEYVTIPTEADPKEPLYEPGPTEEEAELLREYLSKEQYPPKPPYLPSTGDDDRGYDPVPPIVTITEAGLIKQYLPMLEPVSGTAGWRKLAPDILAYG